MAWWGRRRAVDEARWVMVDVEATGLDASSDRLLAIAAVALRVDWASRRLAIELGDSFEAWVNPGEPGGRETILVHGIGLQRQAAGRAPREALEAFSAYAGASPLIAFHASFDRTMLERHAREAGLPVLPGPWLDVLHLCEVLHPAERLKSLDEWMARFGIGCLARHQASADALAQSEVLLRIWPRVAAECRSWHDVEKLAGQRRWLARP